MREGGPTSTCLHCTVYIYDVGLLRECYAQVIPNPSLSKTLRLVSLVSLIIIA